MNERIQEIIEHADIDYDGTVTDVCITMTELHKFAEEIVKECLAMCQRVKDDCEWRGKEFDIDQMQRQIGVNLCVREIKQHFNLQ